MKKARVPLEIPKQLSLKQKFLTGQASLEYFIIFAVIAGLTLLSVSTFLNRTRTSSQDLYSKAVGRILNSQALTPPPTPTSTPAPTSTPTPPGAQLLPMNVPNQLSFAAGTQTTYICRLNQSNITSLKMDIVGRTNATYFTWTWTFPDGTTYSGTAGGTDSEGLLYLRSQKSPNYPNFNADYIPSGDSILTINWLGNSSVILTVGYLGN